MRWQDTSLRSLAAALSVSEVAERLKLNPSRIRAMIAAGLIDAVKVGGRWLIDPETVRRREMRVSPVGRPFSIAKAWGLLMVAAGKQAGWLSPSDLSRVRRRLREGGIIALVPRLQSRAAVQRLRAHPSDLERIAADESMVLTGISAAQDHGLDLVVLQQVEGYLPEKHLRRFLKHYALQPANQPNVLLRVITRLWPFEKGCLSAPASVVGVDLIESDDARTKRAGKQLLAEVEAPWLI